MAAFVRLPELDIYGASSRQSLCPLDPNTGGISHGHGRTGSSGKAAVRRPLGRVSPAAFGRPRAPGYFRCI